jgi:membrane protein
VPLLSYLKQLAHRWGEHDNTSAAAAIGFYAIFMLAPMLVFATSGVEFFMGEKMAQSLTEERLEETVGPSGAKVAREVLGNADFSRQGVIAPAVSVLVLLYSASAIFYHLRKTLDTIFGGSRRVNRGPVVTYALGRLIAVTGVVVATSLMVAILVSQIVLHSLSERILGELHLSEWVWQLASSATTVAVVALAVVGLLKYLPSRPPGWRHVLKGAAVSIVLFELGKWLIVMYISKSVIASAYGPSSAIVAFLLWIFYSTQILILGAEVCQISAERAAEGLPERKPKGDKALNPPT